MRELDVNRLRVLVEVAHAASIAEAARRPAFTPSALSQQIAKLEAELGTRLPERHPTGVTLTPVGEVSRVAVRHLRGLAPARAISILHRRRPTALVQELTAFLHSAGRGVAEAGGGDG
jgi:hypothetical protein